MMSQDPAQAGEQLEQFARELQQKAQRYTELQQRMDSATVTERSRGGEVTVTVDSNGVLTRLDLSERTRGMEPAALSAEIMNCLRTAQARLRENVQALVQDTVGDDPAGGNIAARYAERFPGELDEDGEDAASPHEMQVGGLADDDAERADEPQPPPPPRRPRQDDDGDDFGGSILR